MSDDDKALILLCRVEGNVPVPGSIEYAADCGCRCWISSNALAFIYSGQATNPYTSCMECEGMDRDKIMALGRMGLNRGIPGQREALNELIGEDVTNQLMKDLNITKDGVDD